MSTVLPPIEKLQGRQNCDSWEFAVQTYLKHEELWHSVTGTETDSRKEREAKSVWDTLNEAFEDEGLLRTLITTRQ
ncbi:hypothetical protein JTB14_036914 [Gonioctena quinquepunctata]|nr:hypothetical protein JTB14_036914 [Gonioctena quinquepunctata]